MTKTPSLLDDLLAECEACGIRLLFADDDGLTIDAPQDALTPELLGRLKSHKAELLATLRPAPGADLTEALPNSAAPASRSTIVCRCGSTTWCDVPIHDGQSVRRDCDRCGRFLDFPVWYEQNAFPYAQ